MSSCVAWKRLEWWGEMKKLLMLGNGGGLYLLYNQNECEYIREAESQPYHLLHGACHDTYSLLHLPHGRLQGLNPALSPRHSHRYRHSLSQDIIFRYIMFFQLLLPRPHIFYRLQVDPSSSQKDRVPLSTHVPILPGRRVNRMLCSDHWDHRRIGYWKTPWSLRHHFFRNLAGDDRWHDCVDDQNKGIRDTSIMSSFSLKIKQLLSLYITALWAWCLY